MFWRNKKKKIRDCLPILDFLRKSLLSVFIGLLECLFLLSKTFLPTRLLNLPVAMDSEEKEDAEASFSLLLPLEPKKRKLNTCKCIIWQRCKGNKPLRTPKEYSIEKLITSAKQ